MRIAVLGAGAWGTALAVAAAARHEVVLWGRDRASMAAIAAARRNDRYLPDVALPAGVAATSNRQAALAHAGNGGLVVVATPVAGLREQLATVATGAPLLWLCKGFELGSARLPHEIAREVQPTLAAGVLSGPSFAAEVARRQPTALVVASRDERLRELAVDAFHGETMRIYTSDDVAGVEIGGAVKNVMAVATGMADGLGLGFNARAALITRGIAEMSRLGVALGARAETFMGLSGIGDLVLTATGDLSRNRQVGVRLASGEPLDRILATLGHVAEGVPAAALAARRARAAGVAMPVTEALVEVLQGRATPAAAVAGLLRREARPEG